MCAGVERSEEKRLRVGGEVAIDWKQKNLKGKIEVRKENYARCVRARLALSRQSVTTAEGGSGSA